VRTLAAVALALIPLVLLSATADARKPHCRVAHDGTTLRHTARVLVYQHEDTVVACLRPNGRRYALGTDDGVYNLITVRAIQGSSVTWTATFIPECKADCPPDVTGSTTKYTIDLRTGRRLTPDA
jgi:hypothetical protein